MTLLYQALWAHAAQRIHDAPLGWHSLELSVACFVARPISKMRRALLDADYKIGFS